MAKISLIIPVRNEAKLIGSCLAQFSPPLKERFGIEVIVSDGGSEDMSVAICRDTADIVVLHEDSSRRQTIAEGRNRGAHAASGSILIFLNADTKIQNAEKFFSRITSRLKQEKSLIALAVKVEVFPEERIVSDKIFHTFFNSYVRLINFLGIAMARGECQIIRSEAFREIGGYNDSLAAGEDYELFKRLSRVGKVRYDPQLLVFESPRRYRKYGYGKVYSEWIKNAFSVLFRKKSASKIWEDVR